MSRCHCEQGDGVIAAERHIVPRHGERLTQGGVEKGGLIELLHGSLYLDGGHCLPIISEAAVPMM
jgi:hypothetical protein